MARYVEVAGHRYPFPDDDPRSDADIVEHVARCNREIREEFLRRKHEKRLAEKVVPIRPQGISVIAIGPASVSLAAARHTARRLAAREDKQFSTTKDFRKWYLNQAKVADPRAPRTSSR